MPKRGSFRTQFEFKGVEQIQRLMDGMALTDQVKVLEGALEAASKPIVAAARQEILSAGVAKSLGAESGKLPQKRKALYRTGALYKSLGYIVRRYKQSTRLIAYIGARHMAFAGNVSNMSATMIRTARPLKSDETRVVPSKYIHLVHEGFNNKLTGRRVQGIPFLKNAFDKNIAQAEWTLLSGCADALEKVWNRNVARVARATFKKAA